MMHDHKALDFDDVHLQRGQEILEAAANCIRWAWRRRTKRQVRSKDVRYAALVDVMRAAGLVASTNTPVSTAATPVSPERQLEGLNATQALQVLERLRCGLSLLPPGEKVSVGVVIQLTAAISQTVFGLEAEALALREQVQRLRHRISRAESASPSPSPSPSPRELGHVQALLAAESAEHSRTAAHAAALSDCLRTFELREAQRRCQEYSDDERPAESRPNPSSRQTDGIPQDAAAATLAAAPAAIDPVEGSSSFRPCSVRAHAAAVRTDGVQRALRRSLSANLNRFHPCAMPPICAQVLAARLSPQPQPLDVGCR